MTSERWQEWVLSGLALIWALLLALPDDVLGRVQAYSGIAKFLPDGAWALLMGICALTILLSRTRLVWRAQAHAALGVLWLIIVALILSRGLTVSALLLSAPFAALALLHIFEFLKLSQLARL